MQRHNIFVTHKELSLMVEGMIRAFVARNPGEKIFTQTTYNLLDEILFTAVDSPKAALFTISHIQQLPSYIVLSIQLVRWGGQQDDTESWTNKGICCK